MDAGRRLDRSVNSLGDLPFLFLLQFSPSNFLFASRPKEKKTPKCWPRLKMQALMRLWALDDSGYIWEPTQVRPKQTGMKGGLWSSGPPLWLQHLSPIVFSWGSSGWLLFNSQLKLPARSFSRDLQTARLARQEKLWAKQNKRSFLEWLRAASPVIVMQGDKSLKLKAFVLKVRSLLRPALPPRRPTGSAPTAHIPSDHSCVWHFKEDYENEMW